jgi:multidrug efflux pump subunit AcrA (membrane-fusion protein)
MLPSPAAVYRWFETEGVLQPPAPATLSLPAGGKLVELREANSKYRAGDVLALTDEGKRQLNEIGHLRERMAYYQQMLEAMTAEGNKPEIRQAEIKLKEKRALLDEAMAAFAQVAIVASTDGEIDAVLKVVGDKAKPGDAVLTLKAQQFRAVFTLPHDDAEQAQRLAFCRVMLADVPADCEFIGTAAEDNVVVELPAGTLGIAGQAVSLAKARFDGVFTVPATAVLRVGNSERLFVAGPSGRVEVRAVAIADRNEQEALVAQGLDVGDAVIVDARHELSTAPRVRIAKRILQ